MPEARLLQGNAACAEGAIAAGCRFFAGYPITPSSEIAEEMARRLPALGGVFIQMEDEIASLAAVIGAVAGGARAMTATSGPGFSLMQEHIGYAAMAELPCVVVNVMRGGPSTGLPTGPSQGDVMQARWGTHGDRPAIVLAPASVAEVRDLTMVAFRLAERFATPVTVTYDEVVGHTRERVLGNGAEELPRARPKPHPDASYHPYAAGPDEPARLVPFGDGRRYHITGLFHDVNGFPTEAPATVDAQLRRLHAKVDAHRDELPEGEEIDLEDADVAVFAYGIVGRAAQVAVAQARAAGLRAGLFRPRTLWPFPEEAVARMARRVDAIVVAEMNLGQMAGEVARVAAGACRVERLNRVDGAPISPAQVLESLRLLAGVVA